MFVNVWANTNEHQCLIYTCSSVTNIDEVVQSLNRIDVRFLDFNFGCDESKKKKLDDVKNFSFY